MCQTKDIAIRDWVKLAVTRSSTNRTHGYFLAYPTESP
ncbi:MAG: NADP-dependent isocitrate dehydrogenase [Pirellulaceae bacterium]